MSGGKYVDPYGFSKSSPSSSRSGGGGKSYVDPYRFRGGRGGPTAAPGKHSGGGSVFHWVGSKLGRAGHDIKQIPGGTLHIVEAALPSKEELRHPLRFDSKSAKRQWGEFVTHPVRSYQDTSHGKYGKEAQHAAAQAGGLVIGTKQALRHPLRDPFMTALTLSPVVHGVGRAAEVGSTAAKADRVLRTGGKSTTLLKSRNAGVRLAQRGYDRVVQRALDREARGVPTGRVTGRVAKHGMKRAAGAGAEEERIAQRMRAVPGALLDRSAIKLSRIPGKSGSRIHHAALELTSVQTPAEEAALYHYDQAAAGINPRHNHRVAKIYEHVAKANLVHVDETRAAGEKVFINPAHEKLAATDAALARVQKRGDTILADYGVMTPAKLEERVNDPGRVRAGATYEKPTPGKLGQPSAKLEFRRAEVQRLEGASQRAQERVQRMRFTAADRKRIGETAAPPKDAHTLREQLRPLDKELRRLTEDWNAPAKHGGRMTRAEAEARLSELEKTRQALLEKIVPEVSPYTRETQRVFNKKTKTWSERKFSPEQNRRNTLGGKGGKHGTMKTVKQEELELAEAKLRDMIARNPGHPTLKQADALLREHEQLHRALHENLPGEEAALPETGGASPYEQRARINRVLRKGTSAEKQVKEFAREAGTEPTVHGLNDLKEQAADLTDRINELRGKPGAEIKALRREIGKIRKAIRDAEAPRSRLISGERPHVITGKGEIIRPIGVNHADRIGAALSVARDKLEQAEAAAERRVKPTGLVGGETARPGRGFVSERVSEKRLSRAEASSSRSRVVGEVGAPIDKKSYTGRALAQGLRPKDVTGSASRHFRQIIRFVNTDAIRRRALETGSDVRRSDRDILIRVPGETAPELSSHMRQIIGQEKSTVDTTDELAAHDAEAASTQAGLAAAHRMFVNHILDRTDKSKALGIGEHAPDGYRWVDENMIRGLQQEARPTGGAGAKLGRVVDSANSAVTALTVYFKVGHIGTRVLTNAATNLMQGSLKPHDIVRSGRMWDQLSDEDRARALGAAGQHGFSALPHEGENLVGRAAGRGAQWWARRADAMFRFNSLAYELRKSGYATADEFRGALDALEHSGHGLPAHEWSKISAAARRADREAISYDRLNEFERRYLTRGIWFYPWIKGSTLFTVRSLLEHPFKSAFLGTAGSRGREEQLRTLGEVPSYEQGLISLGGGKHPLTTDFSTFSPFATAADVLEAPAEPGSVAGFLNPVAGAGGQFAYGLNQYGAPSTTPYEDALLALAAPTPEQQLAEAYAARHKDQSQRMFHKTFLNTLARYAVGPATPRRVNRAALAKAAERERSGRR